MVSASPTGNPHHRFLFYLEQSNALKAANACLFRDISVSNATYEPCTVYFYRQ